jgi:alcohol dehydrogenase class IV
MVRSMGGTFQYLNPGTIHWGEGSVAALDAELSRAGVKRVFLITTGSIARNPAVLAPVEAVVGARLVGKTAAIGQHAPVREVARAAHEVREAKADALLSVGGGSPIDAAKAVAWSLAADVDLAEPGALSKARSVRLTGRAVLPHLAVPTTLSVAELSGSAGFSAEGTKEKVGVAAPELVPNAAFYDAALAVHTPLDLWLSTGIRAVDHAVETVLAPGEHPLPDAAALEGLRLLSRGLRAVKEKPPDRAARTDCQVGAWLSYLLPGPAAKGLSHTLGKRIGSTHGIPHGVTSCLLLPHVMRFFITRRPEPLQRIAAVLGAVPATPEAAAAAVQLLIAELGLPQHIATYGLRREDLVEAVGPVAGPGSSQEELLGIMEAAY